MSCAGPWCPAVHVVATGDESPAGWHCGVQHGAGGPTALASHHGSARGARGSCDLQGAAAASAHPSAPLLPLKRREDYNEVVLFP